MPQVLVITDEGEQLGTMAVSEALRLARQRGLDLVEVAPNAVPPVCRILDYGKLRYLYSKKEREAKKGQKTSELREVRLRPRIGTHDLSSKVRKVKELIDDGSKVKVAVVFRGREVTHPGIGLSPPEARGRRSPRRCAPGETPGDGREGPSPSSWYLEPERARRRWQR